MAVRGFSCLSDETKLTLRIDGIEETNTIKYFLDNHKNNNSNNVKIEILTEDGFKPFDGIISRGFRSTVILELSNGETLRCTNDHQLRMEDEYGEPVFIESMFLDSGDILYGGIEVVSKTEIEEPIEVFDALNVSDTHSYITNGVVSHNCNLLMLDEFAFLSNNLAEEFMASVFPTLSSSEESKLVIVSTPNGVNAFHKIWKEAEEGINGFVAVRGWWNELHDQAWADKQHKLLGDVKFRAEVECEFMGSANTLVDGVKVSQIPYINPKTDQNGLRIFEPPKKDHQYFMTVDVSRGRGLDYSAFIIFDTTKTPYNVVATFKNNKISPIEFPTLIAMVGRRFNEATILIENNDLGESVANELWYTHEYAEVLWTKDGKIAGSGTIGLRTTKSVKSKGCSNIKEIIENDQIVLNDLRILEELSVYVLGKNGQYSAQDTRINDDLCACLFLFGWLTEQDYFVDLTNINTSEILSNKFKEQLEDEGFMPFGFIDDGMTENDYPRLNQDQLELLRM